MSVESWGPWLLLLILVVIGVVAARYVRQRARAAERLRAEAVERAAAPVDLDSSHIGYAIRSVEPGDAGTDAGRNGGAARR